MLPNCASGPEKRARVSYRTSAKENFLKGKKALEDEDYLEAMEYFKFVKNKFPYSTYATESDLLMAECHFGRDRFIEAADAYQNFVKLHPKNSKVPYAMYRVGLCYFNRIPEDWWFAPPAYELDQTETTRAIQKLQLYLKAFPQNEYVKEATELLRKCKRRMAERVYYLMEFYLKRKHPRAVLWRAEELLTRYAGLGFDEEALYRKGEALAELGELDDAKAALTSLLKRFPEGSYAGQARDLIEQLQGQVKKKQGGKTS
jgi:outer membrane protein assembly factor BamD